MTDWSRELTTDAIADEIMVWCPTADAAEKLCNYLDANGWRWRSGSTLCNNSCWGYYAGSGGGVYWLEPPRQRVCLINRTSAERFRPFCQRYVFRGIFDDKLLVKVDDLL